jgi:hypothetical protein
MLRGGPFDRLREASPGYRVAVTFRPGLFGSMRTARCDNCI